MNEKYGVMNNYTPKFKSVNSIQDYINSYNTSAFDVGRSVGDVASKVGESGFFSNAFDKLKSVSSGLEGLGGLGNTIGGVANIAGGIAGFYNARKSLKEQKRQNNLLEQQWREQMAMYKEDRARKQAAHKAINDSADKFVL